MRVKPFCVEEEPVDASSESTKSTSKTTVTTTFTTYKISSSGSKIDNEVVQTSSEDFRTIGQSSKGGFESSRRDDDSSLRTIGALEDTLNRLEVVSDQKDSELYRRSKDLDKLKDDNKSYTSRSRYERERNQQLEETLKAKKAEMQDLTEKVDYSKKELTSLLDFSVKYRENAIDSIQDLNKFLNRDKNQTITFGEVNRSTVENDFYRKVLENNGQQVSNSSLPDISKVFKQYKEEVKDQLVPQGSFYEGNVAYLRDLTTLVYELIEKDNTILVLRNIVDILNERIVFDAKDLGKRIDQLETDIGTIDQGTTALSSKVEYMRTRVGDLGFAGPLGRFQDKVKSLSALNLDNAAAKDRCRADLLAYKDALASKDAKQLARDDIPALRASLAKLEGDLESAEDVRRHHLEKYFRLVAELGGLKADIEAERENSIKAVQAKDDDLIGKTEKNLAEAKALLVELRAKIQGDSPLMRKFAQELADAGRQLGDVDGLNEQDKADVRELSNRSLKDDDYFGFIILLSEDQLVVDGHIEDARKRSDDVLKNLKNIKDDFDESEKNLKDQILFDCRKQLSLKMATLQDLEEKLRSLETRLDVSIKTSYSALQILDKNNPDWSEVSKINKDLTQLERDTKGLRLDKDHLITQIQSILQVLDNSDPKTMPMNKVLEIQESTKNCCEDHDRISVGIDEALEKLTDFELRLQKFLQNIRDELKRKTDRLCDDMTDRLNSLNRFLNPSGPVADSIQRPTKLKDLLEDFQLHKNDPDYQQYKEYCTLVNDNLTR